MLAFAGCSAAPASSAVKAESSSGAVSETVQEDSSMASSEAQSTPSITAEKTQVKLAGLKGVTTMGLVKLLDDNKAEKAVNGYDFTMAVSADEITPKLVKGDLDIALVPVNLASVLYNNTKGQIQVLAVNNLGVLSLCEKGDTVNSIADLKGKTIYATGKGATPEYTLKHLLKQNGLDPEKDVTIEWKSEPTEVVAVMSETEGAVAMLPQPFTTVAQTQIEGLKAKINLGEEWKKLGSELVTGVVVARKDFIEKNPQVVKDFLTEYESSTKWVNENVDEAAALVEEYGIVKAPIAKKAMPLCNITCIRGADMKTAVSDYLNILFEQNPKAVGGKMPSDDFYYGG